MTDDEELRASNQHSRPWECLPQAVLNLLDLNSMYVYWDSDVCVWRIGSNNNNPRFILHGVRWDAPLEEWITVVNKIIAGEE